MNCGPHHASAPVTNATHVKAKVESMNDGLKTKIGILSQHVYKLDYI